MYCFLVTHLLVNRFKSNIAMSIHPFDCLVLAKERWSFPQYTSSFIMYSSRPRLGLITTAKATTTTVDGKVENYRKLIWIRHRKIQYLSSLEVIKTIFSASIANTTTIYAAFTTAPQIPLLLVLLPFPPPLPPPPCTINVQPRYFHHYLTAICNQF